MWDYVNELSLRVWEREGRFLSGYDFHPFTRGAGKAGLNLHSQTIQAIGDEYAVRRKQACKTKLPWRVSGGARRSLRVDPVQAQCHPVSQRTGVFRGNAALAVGQL